MRKKLFIPFIMTVLAVLTSCSSKMGALSSDNFSVTPQVLEAVGGKVPVTINGRFPAKYINKKAVVHVTPVLRWNGGQAFGQSSTFQGEKVLGNGQRVSYKNGANFIMRTEFNYVPEMAKSELYLDFNVRVGSKTITIPSVKVADGVISTSALISNTLDNANVSLGEDAFQRVIKEKLQGEIKFLIQQSNISNSEAQAARNFNEGLKAIQNAENARIENVEVSAYASPDGALDLNRNLAEKRQDNTASLINNNLKRDKLDLDINTNYTAEDWEGFKELVEQSNIQDKELILRVLSMYQDPEQREREIKNISSVYKNLADDILPQLRRSRLIANYEIIGKSDEEISQLAATNPTALNVEELLYAATLTDDAAKQQDIYNKASRQFVNDYRALNNMGKLAYEAGNYDLAESYLKEAARVKDAPEVNNNLALIALKKGNLTEAEAYIGKAAGSKELSETMGNLYVAQGQYERAVNAFGDAKTNSAALAQILAKDYNKAKNTLDAITRADAYTGYLKAVLGARTNNENLVISGLREAIEKDRTMARKAANDLEFAKYYGNSSFANLIR